MAKEKRIALGSTVYVDHDSDTTYTLVGLTKSITPPGTEKSDVDATVLGDTLEVPEAGIEAASTFEFMELADPAHTDHAMLQTLCDNNTKVNWRVVYPAAVAKQITFQGRVKSISNETLEVKGVVGRKIVVQRTGAITLSSVS